MNKPTKRTRNRQYLFYLEDMRASMEKIQTYIQQTPSNSSAKTICCATR